MTKEAEDFNEPKGDATGEYFEHQSEVNAMNLKGVADAWQANLKRTYDEFQQLSLESARRNRTFVDRTIGNNADHDQQVRNVSLQALQNAVETANMVGKNAVATCGVSQNQVLDHRDLGHDRAWNVDEQGYTAANILEEMQRSGVYQDMTEAIAVAVIAKMAEPK
jgi:hypothetical protein